MAGTPRKRARREAQTPPRELPELLQVIGANPHFPLSMGDVVAAYEEGSITGAEARQLQSFSHRSLKGQKRALKESRPVTDAQIAAMRAKLDAAAAKIFGSDWDGDE